MADTECGRFMSTRDKSGFCDIAPSAWAGLNEKTIFFGHQSVGRDIICGIQDLAAAHESLRLNIVETKDASEMEGPMLAHALIGRNSHPESKIAEFRTLMRSAVSWSQQRASGA